jgi:alpha-tubulin suppressor-like RCC1 family protein
VDVHGLGSGVTAIAAANTHSCAVTTAGDVQCWGDNRSGQLGDGTLENRLLPITVSALSGSVRAVTSGSQHTCALTTAGGVKCWGDNSSRQLGHGYQNYLTPVDVTGLSSGVQAIAAGSFHTCALTTGGGVKCWGSNEHGQLGDGSTLTWDMVDVVGLSAGVLAIRAGSQHTCALTTGGGVKCWGDNEQGQLGDGTTEPRSTPVDVVGLTRGVQAIAAGGAQTCALTITGGVKCWGANAAGQLGDSTQQDRATPVDVVGLARGAQAISTGAAQTCALTISGVKCWGSNDEGQLGLDPGWTPRFVVTFNYPAAFLPEIQNMQ